MKKAEHPSTVLIAFGLAGGTGSGMAIDLVRNLSSDELQRKVPVVGVGQLSHSGDGDYYNNLTPYMTIEQIDQAMQGIRNDLEQQLGAELR